MAHLLLHALGGDNSADPDDGWFNPRHQTHRGIVQQFIISAGVGLGAFTTFCLIRPKWPQFYNARKRRARIASSLPELPPTLFGWIPILWNVSDQDVLAAAGLDAYVFLAFFKMAIRFLLAASVLAAIILFPINSYYGDENLLKEIAIHALGFAGKFKDTQTAIQEKPGMSDPPGRSYLWANLVFVYIFTGLVSYFLWDQTKEVIQVRQAYLGRRLSITDRTIKLSGVPENLRSESSLKEYIERLQIGKVENVTICKHWKELDRLLENRQATLRKLEEAYTSYQSVKNTQKPLPSVHLSDHSDEESRPLIEGYSSHRNGSDRPRLTLRYGKCMLKCRKVDAIDYFTMKLQTLDDQITEARRKEYKPTALAFATMDSAPAAQVAMQALLDPSPGVMIARQAPAPSDIIWENTYLSRTSRLFRLWSISIFVTLLSIFWLIPVAALAGLWNLSEIRRVWPDLADKLEEHEALSSLIQTFLPTLVLTLLNISVPYLYEWLSQYQGLISRGEIELSVISKNFFFTFFNLFLAFTISGTALTFHSLWDALKGSLKDTQKVTLLLAKAVEDLAPFYVNLIILQGLGMFPLRLLQIDTVTLYPFCKLGAKTPRDNAELSQPAMFQYSFFLPQPILIFIICIVYSVLPRGVLVLTFGLIYFVLGYFTYKYQLLYAMDHPRSSTGKAWPVIVHRVIIGLIVFQLTMAGWLALKQAYTRAAMVTPLLGFTVWMYWHYDRNYRPSSYYIALKSIVEGYSDPNRNTQSATLVNEEGERKFDFINPSLVSPLENVWVAGRAIDGSGANDRD